MRSETSLLHFPSPKMAGGKFFPRVAFPLLAVLFFGAISFFSLKTYYNLFAAATFFSARSGQPLS